MAQLPHAHLMTAACLIAMLINANPCLGAELRIHGQGMPRGPDGLVAKSSNEQFSLRVVSEVKKPFQYKLLQGDNVLWTQLFDFVPEDAQITNVGTSLFFGYRNDVSGSPYAQFYVIDKSGRGLVVEEWSRKHLTLHSHPVPVIDQIVIDTENDRLILRLKVEGKGDWFKSTSSCCGDPYFGVPAWRVYRLSTGEFLEEFDPDERFSTAGAMQSCLAEAKVIPGTPLLAVLFYDNDHCGNIMHDSRVLIVQLPNTIVAQTRVSGIYSGLSLGSGNFAPPASFYFRQNPMVFTDGPPHQFRVKLFGVPFESTFVVGKGADGNWQLKGLSQLQAKVGLP